MEVFDGGIEAGSLVLPVTGSGKTIAATTLQLTLDAGTQTLRIASDRRASYDLFGLNLSYAPPTTTLSSLPAPVPAPALLPYVPPAVTTTTTTNTSSPDPAVIPGLSAMAVTLNEHSEGLFNELDVQGAAAGETITVSQSGGTLTIDANGQLYHNAMTLGELVIYAGAGNDTISVNSTVTIPTRIYSGQGNDTITDLTTGQATIITLEGTPTASPATASTPRTGSPPPTRSTPAPRKRMPATCTPSPASIKPYTTTPGATGYVTSTRDGSNLVDPTSLGSGWTRLSSSLWGLGPVQQDVNQGQASDCYFLTDLQSLARLQPGRLQQMAVDLGDGTYAVQFVRNGSPVYVRVDGDLPTASWGGLYYAHPGPSGDQWVAIMEKAYAYLRTGANSYPSLDFGYMTNVYTDLGVSSSSIALPFDQNSFMTTVNNQLSANKPVDILTHTTILNSAPLVASHCYAVISATQDASGTVWITLRNPWGIDGFNDDSNPNDGFVTVSYATLYANVTYASLVNA